MRRTPAVVASLILSGALAAPAAAGQTPQTAPVARLVPDLLLTAAQIQPGSLPVSQANVFVAGLQQLATPGQLGAALALGFGSAPLGPTSSGTMVLSQEPGVAGAPTFGSGFGARAFTIGQRQLGVSVTYETTDYATYDGLDVAGGGIHFFLPQSGNLSDPNQRDLLQEQLAIKMNRKVVGFVLDYGLTKRFDVGLVVPIVQVAEDARVTSLIERTATSTTPSIHEFDPIGLGNKTFYGSATARGLGDVVVRARYTLVSVGGGAVAATLDARLPTGSKDDFLGLGAKQVTPGVVWSGTLGPAAAHASASFTWSSGTLTSDVSVTGTTAAAPPLTVPNEVDYGAGLVWPVVSRVSAVVDVTGRQMSNVPAFTAENQVFPSRGPGPVASATGYTAIDDFLSTGVHNVTSVLTDVGTRIDVGRRVVANGSLVFSGGNAGLKPTMALAFWLDYRF